MSSLFFDETAFDARVLQHKAACAVSAFHHPGLSTHLAEERSVLVARDASNRDPGQYARRLTANAARIDNLRQQRSRNIEQREQFFIPLLGMYVEQHRARRIRHVGHVPPTSRQLPDKPAIDRSEGKFASLGLLARPLYVIK